MAFGRLRASQAAQPISAINVTPLVDVMLVLVVIFILAAPLLAASLRLDLPQARSATPSDAPAAIAVQIDAEGRLFADGEATDLPALQARLKQVGASRPDTEVQLSVDRAVPYGSVVGVMDAAHSAGLSRLGFVAQPAGGSKK
ncbi:MAG: ExbD/TolR family protein [Comamonas sp.]